jgi:hypothetical protein
MAICVLGLAVQSAGAQGPRTELEEELTGAPVYSIDGTEVGVVEALKFGADDQIEEVTVSRAQWLGIGSQTVVVPRGKFIALRGAVVIELTAPEIHKLPSESR